MLQLYSDGQPGRFYPTDQEKDENRISDSITLTARGAESLFRLLDIAPEWMSLNSRERIAGVVDAVTSLPVPSEADVVARAYSSAALSSALTHGSLISTKALEGSAKSRLEARKSAAARRLTDHALESLIQAAESLAQTYDDPYRGPVTNQVHPCVLHHIVRALWMVDFVQVQLPSALSGRIPSVRAQVERLIRRATEELIARHELQLVRHGEAIALGFCAAGLSFAQRADRRYIDRALAACLEAQSADGAWPLARVSDHLGDFDDYDTLRVSTYEVAWIVAELVAQTTTATGSTRAVDHDAVGGLVSAAAYASGSRVDRSSDTEALPAHGWTLEHEYGEPTIEVAPTAMVLNSITTLRRLSDEVRSLEALESFDDVVDPAKDYWPPWARWSTYKKESEPDRRVKILDYLDREIVQPRVQNEVPWSREDNAVILMFGPPGTTKTTIVRSVADGLGWPLVTLTPGNFIRRGLEMVEAEASEVFERLHALRRAVVLFDECDELFRHRGRFDDEDDEDPDPGEQRGITAFMTASMLPKLQDLHDRGQVVVFILTNYFRRMDPAMKRLGRLDLVVGVGPPDGWQRRKILGTKVDLSDPLGKAAVKELVARTKRFNRPELLNAAELLNGRLVALRRSGDARDEDAENVAREVASAVEERVTISPSGLDRFKTLARDQSFPHIERGSS